VRGHPAKLRFRGTGAGAGRRNPRSPAGFHARRHGPPGGLLEAGRFGRHPLPVYDKLNALPGNLPPLPIAVTGSGNRSTRWQAPLKAAAQVGTPARCHTLDDISSGGGGGSGSAGDPLIDITGSSQKLIRWAARTAGLTGMVRAARGSLRIEALPLLGGNQQPHCFNPSGQHTRK
jgi:hypothetical protein